MSTSESATKQADAAARPLPQAGRTLPTRPTRPDRRPPGRISSITMRHKRQMLRTHRWLSLVLATWVVLQGLSGLVMIAGDQINRLSHPGLFDHGRGDLGPAAAEGAALRAVGHGSVQTIALPAAERDVYRVTVGIAKTKAQRLVYVDPASAKVNGIRDPKGGFVAWTGRWHNSLLQTHPILGIEPGYLVGWLGVATLLVLLSGLYLWYWPRTQRWRSLRKPQRRPQRRGAYRALGRWHRLLGVVATPVLVVLLLSGINIAFRQQLRPWWYRLTPGADHGAAALARPPASTSKSGTPLTVDQLIAASHRYTSGAIDAVTPAAAKGTAQVKVSSGWDPARGPEGRGGNVVLYLDQYDGHLVATARPGDKPVAGQAYEYWSTPVHFGTFGGPVSRSIWLLATLAPLLLLCTGAATMLYRANKRRRHYRRTRQALPGLTRAEAKRTATGAAPRDCTAGDVLIRQGDPSDSFFIIVSGTLEASQEQDGATTAIRTMGPGDRFGEIGLMNGTARTATVVAVTDAELLFIGAEALKQLLDESTAARAGLAEVAAQRLREHPAPPTS